MRNPFRKSALNRHLFRIAGPAMLTMISQTVVMVTDTAMVGILGKEAIAATGIGGFVVFTVFAVFFGASMAVQIIVARRTGEENHAGAASALVSSLYGFGSAGLLVAAAGWFCSDSVAALMSDHASIVTPVRDYLYWRFLGLPFYIFSFLARGYFDGIGRTEVSFASSLVAMTANVFLNWILIGGNLGAPALGVAGASLASSVAGFLGLLVYPLALFSGRIRSRFQGVRAAPQPGLIAETFRIGLPTSADNLLLHLAFLLFFRIADGIGANALAATNILISILSLSFMPGFAFGVAATTIVGQSIGSRRPRQGLAATARAALFASFFMSFMGFCFIIFRSPLIGLFTSEDAVITETMPALVLVALIQWADGWHMVYSSALRGAGHVMLALICYFAASYLIMLPAAWFFSRYLQWGTLGLWAGIGLWILFLAVSFRRLFHAHRWRGREV